MIPAPWHDAPGRRLLLMGNEAIARGALEAGVSVCAGYPGNPSSEIIGTLARAAQELDLHVQWSTNEKVAMEVAASASLAGLRGLTAMKQNGLNVASDFLLNLNLSGCQGGLVVVVTDDPSGLSSTNEQDTRLYARMADLPLLEPSTPAEAKEMVRQAFELSEELALPCLVRSVTRVSHARGVVQLGPLRKGRPLARLDRSRTYYSFPALPHHRALRDKLRRASALFEHSAFSFYKGPDEPELLVVAAGAAWTYVREAVELLDLGQRVGVLKLGPTWPLAPGLLGRHLARSGQVLFAEEVESFIESQVKALWAQRAAELGPKVFFGRESGLFADTGELSLDLVLEALGSLLGVAHEPRPADYSRRALEAEQTLVPARQVGLCPGCPHRATYWAVKQALALDGREGFVLGDIGCYSLAFGPSGFHQLSTLHAMGSGPGLASGMGRLGQFGLSQPVLTVVGDSTFFHAALPALINARYNEAGFLLLVLDNSATAMTGFQPHPGLGIDALGRAVPRVEIEGLCRALGLEVHLQDPFDLAGTVQKILELLDPQQRAGIRVLVLRQPCGIVARRDGPEPPAVRIDPDRCLGQACGCNRLCTRVFRCPGLVWEQEAGRARIDEAVCSRCGVCIQICPAAAICREAADE